MSMRATDEGDEEETSVYLSQPPVSTLDIEGRDISQHGSDSRGYKSLLHDQNNSGFMPSVVSESIGAISSKVSDISSYIQATFEVKENLDNLIRILNISTFGLILTVFIIILVQHNPRHGHSSYTSVVGPPTMMPTFSPDITYDFESMMGKVISGVPTSYIYQSSGCMRECYRGPFYDSPNIDELVNSCQGNLFFGVRNAVTDIIEVGSFQYSYLIFQEPNVVYSTGNEDKAFGTESNGLYWYTTKNTNFQRSFGFSDAYELTFNGIEPKYANEFDCHKTFLMTATSNPGTTGAVPFSGLGVCERFSLNEQSLGSLHEVIIFRSTC